MSVPAVRSRSLVAAIAAIGQLLVATTVAVPSRAAWAQGEPQPVPGRSLLAMHVGKTIVERSIQSGREIFSYYSPDGRLYLGNGRGGVRITSYDIYGDQLCIDLSGQMSCYRVYVLDGQPYYVLPSGRAYSSIEYVANGDLRHMQQAGSGIDWGNALVWGMVGLGAFCLAFGCGGDSAGSEGGDAGVGYPPSPEQPPLEWEERRTTGFCGKSPDGENMYSPSCDLPR